MTIVNIGRAVEHKDLERALIKAAEETGLNIKPKEEFSKKYQLGQIGPPVQEICPVQEISEYSGTTFHLSGRFFPAMQIKTDKSGRPRDYFFLYSGFGFGFASGKKVKRYLDAVSRNL